MAGAGETRGLPQRNAASVNAGPDPPPAERQADAGPTAGDRLLWFVAPVAAALVAMRVEFAAPSTWLVLVAAVVLGDGRAIGAWLGARLLAGRSTGTGLRVGVANSVGGPLPLAVAFALHAGGIIDPALFAALVLAAGLTTLLATPTMRLSRAVWPDDEPADAGLMQ